MALPKTVLILEREDLIEDIVQAELPFKEENARSIRSRIAKNTDLDLAEIWLSHDCDYSYYFLPGWYEGRDMSLKNIKGGRFYFCWLHNGATDQPSF